jgi:ferredoxin
MTIVEDIKSANLCIGCGYCASLVSGSMVLDDAGFLVPSDDSTTLSPEEEALVKTSCPGIRGDSVFTQRMSIQALASTRCGGGISLLL